MVVYVVVKSPLDDTAWLLCRVCGLRCIPPGVYRGFITDWLFDCSELY